MLKILIFPAGTEISFEIFHALKYSKFVSLFGATSVDCHAEMLFENYIKNVPFITDRNFLSDFNKILEENAIDYIYPAYDDVQLFLSRNENNLSAKILSSPLETIEICRSKKKTYNFFEGENFIPKIFESIGEVDKYPVFVKPEIGQGSQGALKINSQEDLFQNISDNPQNIICEYLAGNEFTVDCFTDFKGNLLLTVPRTRERIRNGISVRSRIFDLNPQIKKIADTLNKKLKFVGAWYFQLKEDYEGNLKLLEVSARISGTMGLTRNLGVNFPLLTIFTFNEQSVKLMLNDKKILVERAFISRYKYFNLNYDDIYIDLDDTLIIRDKVNLTLIRFLYQSVNENKKIHLLTRHRENVFDTLKKYKISSELFDTINVLNLEQKKSEFIKSQKAIFIDDSFAERLEVKSHLNISVFDVDMIESLLNYKEGD